MTFKIFNCYNGFVEVDVGQKEIDFIVVAVLQGDEVVRIYFKDGTSVKVDSCHVFGTLFRNMAFYDGVYVVTSDKLKEWIDIGDSSNNPINSRLNAFCDIDSIDNLGETVNGVRIAQSKRRNDNDECASALENLVCDIEKYKAKPILKFVTDDDSNIDFQKFDSSSYRIIGRFVDPK